MSVSWNSGNNQLTVESRGSWHQLTAITDHTGLRSKFKKLASSDLPFKSFLTFPTYPGFVIVRLWAPWEINRTVELVKDVAEDTFTCMANLALPSVLTMKVHYDVSIPSNYLHPALPKSTFDEFILAALKVQDIAFFHFLKKDLPKETAIAIKRELQEKKLLSESSRNAHPLLKGIDFGVTTDNDRQRDDHGSVHCFFGFPLLSNAHRIHRIPTVLAHESMIQIAFQDLADTVITPCDLELDLSEPFSFQFLNDEYSITIDDTNNYVTYSSKSKGFLFAHKCAEETFFGKSSTGITALFAVLIHFANTLEDAQKYAIWQKKQLLLELFNDLFAFRVQLSIPNELECKPYHVPHCPKAKIEAEINEDAVLIPDLEACKQSFEYTYSTVSYYIPMITAETSSSLKKIIRFFTSPLNDGTNIHPDAFGYYGATAAQLLLHFDQELAGLLTEEVVRTIMQLNKAYEHDRHPITTELYRKYLFIKRTNHGDITLFSLIKRGLEDLDLIQYRLPPNRPFDRPVLQIEIDYQLQLKTFSTFGSKLLKSITNLSTFPVEMIPFSLSSHRNDTITRAIERLIYPVQCDAATFSNLHGYLPDAFVGEYERGIMNYIDNFEITHENVVQSHIVDFVQRLVRGSHLLEPRFKHDLLDLKHFIAGLHSDRCILFVDGRVSFREIILRCLYEIQRQQTISINSQLLIDTLFVFLKTVKVAPSPGCNKDSNPALAALKIVNLTGYLGESLDKVIHFLSKTKPDELPYVIKCLNLLRFRLDTPFVQAATLVHPFCAIRQKLAKVESDFSTERYFILLPPL